MLAAVLRGEPDQPGKGGVRLCRSIDEVREAAQEMIGGTLVTKQTGLTGVEVKTVLVTTGADIAREIYAAVLLDRQKSKVLLMASSEGGTEIEEVAATKPEAIHKVWADPVTGLGSPTGADHTACRLIRLNHRDFDVTDVLVITIHHEHHVLAHTVCFTDAQCDEITGYLQDSPTDR